LLLLLVMVMVMVMVKILMLMLMQRVVVVMLQNGGVNHIFTQGSHQSLQLHVVLVPHTRGFCCAVVVPSH